MPTPRGHLRVVHRRADHRADAGAVQREPEQPRPPRTATAIDEDAVDRKDEPPIWHGPRAAAAAPGSCRDRRPRSAAPGPGRSARSPWSSAPGPASGPEPAQEERVPCPCRSARWPPRRRAAASAKLWVAQRHREAHVAAQHEVRAVRQVDDAHHAEDEREAAGEQEEERAVGEAVERLDDPEVGGTPESGSGQAQQPGARSRGSCGPGRSGRARPPWSG